MKYKLLTPFHYGTTIFLSAFLLFQVQPLIGKMILPWFGGSASVWTTCMLFFQATLLFGYVYAHWVAKALSPYRQGILHILLLLVSLWMLPITASELWKPTGNENPTFQILSLLLASIGLPYFVLSTTGPLIQVWFAREKTGGIPYRLFALSNFGSILALLAYPIAFESLLPTNWQSYCWSAMYGFFAVSCGILAWHNRNNLSLVADKEEGVSPPATIQLLIWIILAACPSILMIADTSFLTENIAPIPMIWVAPLTLYLLSFIICFERDGWYRRQLFLPLFVLALFILAYLPTLGMDTLPIWASMVINLAAFFIVCMVCHGELAIQQPHSQFLTTYYLMLSIGGVVGGFFVGVVAPYWFNENFELSIGILLTGIVISVLFLTTTSFSNLAWKIRSIFGITCFLSFIGGIRIIDHYYALNGSELSLRNFYGTLKVLQNQEGTYRLMRHGQIGHGGQYTAPNKALEPTTYYVQDSGVGKVILIEEAKSRSIRVGVVGLGVGTLASYGRSSDVFRFYEINPQVIEVANQKFTFLSTSPAKVEVVLGDARLQLEREPAQQFDVLVIDAFSGDSVPIHLLTQEAFAQYFRHLKKGGVLALHITNRFLDLKPVVKMAADQFGEQIRVVSNQIPEGKEGARSHWALMSSDKYYFKNVKLLDAQEIIAPKNFKPWKDDHSSLISVLYW